MKTPISHITASDASKIGYFNTENQPISLAALADSLDMITDIMDACRDEMDDFLSIHCGNGMYQGHFMLVKLGLEHAISVISGLRPDADSEKGGES